MSIRPRLRRSCAVVANAKLREGDEGEEEEERLFEDMLLLESDDYDLGDLEQVAAVGVEVLNVVATFDLKCLLDLNDIVDRGYNVDLTKPGVSAMQYQSLTRAG